MMSMEAWTVRSMKETRQYVRVSMNEKVTLYIWKTPRRDKKHYTDVYFYGPNHAKRAKVYATLTGGKITPGNPIHAKETATTVEVPRD